MIHTKFSWVIILNCLPQKIEKWGWQQTHFELNFKHPFTFKRIVKYYGEKKQCGIDRETNKPIEIDVWDGQPRFTSSADVRLIERTYILPFVDITNYYITKLGGQRNREIREYFEKESEREKKEYESINS